MIETQNRPQILQIHTEFLCVLRASVVSLCFCTPCVFYAFSLTGFAGRSITAPQFLHVQFSGVL